MEKMDSREMALAICNALADKKAADIMLIKVSELTIVADYFVICSGKTNVQVKALTEHLEEKMESVGIVASRKDGVKEGRWIAMDYGAVIVHIFHDDERLFFNLEKLWSTESNVEHYNPISNEME